MFCPKCGAELQNSSKFCGACGNPLRSPADYTPQTPQANPESPANQAPQTRPAQSETTSKRSGKKKPPVALIGGIVAAAALVIGIAVGLMFWSSSGAHSPFGASGPVSISSVISMSSTDLGNALEADGYTHTTEGNLEVYDNGTREVSLDASNGTRTILLPEASDVYQTLKDEGQAISKLGQYTKSGDDTNKFCVGLCEMENGQGLLVGGSDTVYIIEPNHMSKLDQIAHLGTDDSMSAEQTAAIFVKSLIDVNIVHTDGDEIDTSLADTAGEDEENTQDDENTASDPASLNSIYGSYEDRRDGPTDDHGYFTDFRIYKDPYHGGTYLSLTWVPGKYDSNGNEIDLMYERIQLNEEIEVVGPEDCASFASIGSKSTGTYFDGNGSFLDGSLKLSGYWTVTTSDNQELQLLMDECVLYRV